LIRVTELKGAALLEIVAALPALEAFKRLGLLSFPALTVDFLLVSLQSLCLG
jgi:hypothetical protein